MLRAMERAPLRPVPTRPAGPVDPAVAIRHVGRWLPDLDEEAVRALALVEIAGRPRSDLEGDAGAVLARARKALRRSTGPLPGSGWCERAERLISDRIDGALEAPGPTRLEAHLANCPRCVEHDLRLAQAADALLRAFAEAHPTPLRLAAVASPTEEDAAPVAAAANAEAAPPPPAAPVVSRVLLAVAVLLAVLAVAIAVAASLGASL